MKKLLPVLSLVLIVSCQQGNKNGQSDNTQVTKTPTTTSTSTPVDEDRAAISPIEEERDFNEPDSTGQSNASYYLHDFVHGNLEDSQMLLKLISEKEFDFSVAYNLRLIMDGIIKDEYDLGREIYELMLEGIYADRHKLPEDLTYMFFRMSTNRNFLYDMNEQSPYSFSSLVNFIKKERALTESEESVVTEWDKTHPGFIF